MRLDEPKQLSDLDSLCLTSQVAETFELCRELTVSILAFSTKGVVKKSYGLKQVDPKCSVGFSFRALKFQVCTFECRALVGCVGVWPGVVAWPLDTYKPSLTCSRVFRKSARHTPGNYP